MEKAENGREEEATVDVQFTDLPNALIACKVPEDLFDEGSLKVRRKHSQGLGSNLYGGFRRVWLL